MLADADDDNERTSTVIASELIEDGSAVSRSLPPVLPPPPDLPSLSQRAEEVSQPTASKQLNLIKKALINPVQERYGLRLRPEGLEVPLASDAEKVLLRERWNDNRDVMAEVMKLILCSLDPAQYQDMETKGLDQNTYETLIGVLFITLDQHGYGSLKQMLEKICPQQPKEAPLFRSNSRRVKRGA